MGTGSNAQNGRIVGSEQTFAVRLMQHLVVPTFVLDAERRVIIWNKACERLTGIPAADVVGTREHWQAFYQAPRYCLADFLAAGKIDQLSEHYNAHVVPDDTGLGLGAENWCVMPRLGKRLYLAVDAGPIYDEDGTLIAVVETLRDMTEQKLAQMALESLAIKDGLTGLANRRCFDDTLEAEWLRAHREKRPISLLIADVDCFKVYNDTYGHQKGDECLRTVAAVIRDQIFRPADLAARYGGEEFAVILPMTDLEGAKQVADRIQSTLFALNIPHIGRDGEQRVTISIGVASTVPTGGTGSATVVAAADEALYAAKRAGRNRVVCTELGPVADTE